MYPMLTGRPARRILYLLLFVLPITRRTLAQVSCHVLPTGRPVLAWIGATVGILLSGLLGVVVSRTGHALSPASTRS